MLFNRRWLSADAGERLSGVQAACWLDVKRVYLELRPELRRIYTAVCDIETFAPIVTPLGFVPLPEVVELGDLTFHSAFLDFGPSSIDGWLAKLVASELLIEQYSILDPVERQLVLDGRRVDLTRLEFDGASTTCCSARGRSSSGRRCCGTCGARPMSAATSSRPSSARCARSSASGRR